MSPTEAVSNFGNQSSLARALGVTPQAVNKWIAQDRIPLGRQYQLQVLTGGQLAASKALSVSHKTAGGGGTFHVWSE